MLNVNGGINGEAIFGGICLAATAVGCIAIAATPGVNVIAAACAYAGSWAIAGSVTSTVYGLVK